MGISSSTATTILGMSIDEIANDAELVFQGQVIEHNVQENSSGIIVTYVTFQISDVIKGSYPSPTLELKFTGGELAGQKIEVSGLRIPRVDEKGIYFIESINRDLVNPLFGWSQGHFLIVSDDAEQRVATLNLVPVTDLVPIGNIPPNVRRPRSLIDGDSAPASGVVTDAGPFQFQRALSVDEFKSRIRQMIE